MPGRPILAIAERTFRDSLGARWLGGFGLLFAALTIGTSYFGLVSAREVGFQGFAQVSASLLNLILFTVPLVALALPILDLTADEGLILLLTQPLERYQALAGKLLGMASAVALTVLGGLLLGGIVVLNQAGSMALSSYLWLMLLTFLLVVVFVALGGAVAILSRDRSRALGVGLGLWFLLTILYDLLVVGWTIVNPGIPLRILLVGALLLNPIDAVRVCYLLATQNSSFVGVTGALLSETLGHPGGLGLLVGDLVGMVVVATGIAMRVFSRRDY